MSRSQILRQNTINQFITCINNQIITFPLPSLSILADTFNISRTTVRAVLSYLIERGVLIYQQQQYFLIRQPTEQDKINGVLEKRERQDQQIEHYFYALINSRQLLPGDKFNEIEIARDARVTPLVVREFLLRFLHYGLIENISKGEWQLVIFGRDYAEKLYEFRSVLEIFALQSLMKQLDNKMIWTKAKELLQHHEKLAQNISHDYKQFSTLDRDFHRLILSANDNPFFVQSFELISVIFHFHYQWDERDLKERNSIAVSEHIAVLKAILQRQEALAIKALCKHLNTAKCSMRRALGRIDDKAIQA
ncbi:GntR family transcriptional regulator [Utexia brackfieldae]|uniref:GntR family transcriptional regulator n=1 Tax=Utexia brackfieldae TaxID=3074108 RepID=UPI00370D5CCC